MPAIANGMPAPDFELPDQHGRLVRLRQYRGKNAVVVYFYPKDDTTGCTIEACRFRDDFKSSARPAPRSSESVPIRRSRTGSSFRNTTCLSHCSAIKTGASESCMG